MNDIDRADFLAELDVSRETAERFDLYAALLNKWTPAINLVSSASLPRLWSRHFRDSAQLLSLTDLESGHWADIGSGGGFPGMVCAILLAEKAPGIRLTLVESDQRKAEFLRTVSRETSVQAEVLAGRIENLSPLQADIISARALAPLPVLLRYAERHLKAGGRALFMKGATFRTEIEEALETWRFQSEEYPSSTDGAGIVLSLGEIRRV